MDFDQTMTLLEKIPGIISALLLAIPLAIKAWVDFRAAARTAKEEFEKKKDEGLQALVPWVVRKAHKGFAMYRAWHGYSDSQKKEAIKDLIVAAHRRHNGESAISEADVNKVLHWAEAHWKDNKAALKEELNKEQPVVAAVLDALAKESGAGAAPAEIPPEVHEAAGEAAKEVVRSTLEAVTGGEVTSP